MSPLFKKKEIFKVKSVPVDPGTMGDPSTSEEYTKRGVAYYARKQFNSAETDLKHAILLDENNLDAYYSLGMVLKAVGRKEDAINAFNKVLELINARPDATSTKYDMLRRLALGHYNELKQGDWNLEKEIWKHQG